MVKSTMVRFTKPVKTQHDREDMILIKGKFYYVDDIDMTALTAEMLLS